MCQHDRDCQVWMTHRHSPYGEIIPNSGKPILPELGADPTLILLRQQIADFDRRHPTLFRQTAS